MGDNILSFSSIIPIQIGRTLDIDLYTGQIKVEGQAALYSHLDSLSHLEGRVREEEADGLLRYYPV